MKIKILGGKNGELKTVYFFIHLDIDLDIDSPFFQGGGGPGAGGVGVERQPVVGVRGRQHVGHHGIRGMGRARQVSIRWRAMWRMGGFGGNC